MSAGSAPGASDGGIVDPRIGLFVRDRRDAVTPGHGVVEERSRRNADSPVRMFWKALSTLLASKAEVSMNSKLFSAGGNVSNDLEEHACKGLLLAGEHRYTA
jgi:hypothetical protein